jgi:hypothetical protein
MRTFCSGGSIVFRRNQLHEGMNVYSVDGEKLGRVGVVGTRTFLIEKGFYFQTDFPARLDDVAEVREGSAYLKLHRDEFLKESFEDEMKRAQTAPADERLAKEAARETGFETGTP